MLVLGTDEIWSSDLIKVSAFSGFWFQASASQFSPHRGLMPNSMPDRRVFHHRWPHPSPRELSTMPIPILCPLVVSYQRCNNGEAVERKGWDFQRSNVLSWMGFPFLTDYFFSFNSFALKNYSGIEVTMSAGERPATVFPILYISRGVSCSSLWSFCSVVMADRNASHRMPCNTSWFLLKFHTHSLQFSQKNINWGRGVKIIHGAKGCPSQQPGGSRPGAGVDLEPISNFYPESIPLFTRKWVCFRTKKNLVVMPGRARGRSPSCGLTA